jgi:transglutaminase-like putative cysteine protease
MPDLRDRLLHPREGWLSLGLLIVMLVALAWSVQGAAWLNQLEYLPPVAFWAALTAAVLALLPISVTITLPASALIGTAVVVWTIGGEYFPAIDLQLDRLFALREELIDWTFIVVRGGYPSELTPYALGLGIVMWTTGFIATYTVYRHHRVLDAILLVGMLIVANMSATFTNLFVHLMIFVIAALLLWLRAALTSREEGWQRRRVTENYDVPASILRSGVVFAGGSVALAWILTTVAVAAPLTEAWRGLDDVWVDVRDRFENVFSQLTNPQARISGNSFGSGFVVDGEWVSNDAEVLLLAASKPLYLRTATYDEYTGKGFVRSESERVRIEAGERIFGPDSPEVPWAFQELEEGDRETVTIEVRGDVGRSLFAPGFALRILAPVDLHQPGGAPLFGGIQASSSISSGEAYLVDAFLGVATEAQLSTAGTDYPEIIQAMYLDDSRVTERVRALAEELTADAANPYEAATALATYLRRDQSFTYSTSAPIPGADEDLVDFFLFAENGRIGFCQYYASAMAVMARAVGIPARVATGFAPGERVEEGRFLVREANSHAWAELYFPGYGWQIFESTKSINPRFTRAQGGTVVPPDRPPDGTSMIDRLFEGEPGADDLGAFALPSFNPVEGGIDPRTGTTDSPDEASNPIGGLVLLALILAGVGFALYQLRRMRLRMRLMPVGDRAWWRLGLAAERAGVGQRPSETIYEYSGWLEDQIPTRRPEIRTIADGKVWESYSGRRMSRPAAIRLEAAWRRLRAPFMRLTVRHWLRSLVRR